MKFSTYFEKSIQLLKEFKNFRLEHVPRLHNEDANRLAQHASGYQPMINATSAVSAGDWRKEIIDYLKDPSKKVERRVRFQATKYVLLENELYYRTVEGILLQCLGDDEARSLMGESMKECVERISQLLR